MPPSHLLVEPYSLGFGQVLLASNATGVVLVLGSGLLRACFGQVVVAEQALGIRFEMHWFILVRCFFGKSAR